MAALADEYLPSYTYDDYCQWEGEWELIGGIAYAMAPSPILTHQALASLLIQSIGKSLDDCTECMVVSEMDYKLADDTVLRPDIALICGQKEGAYIYKAPELIIEIVSPSTAVRDEKLKLSLYEAEKIPWYILLYPEDLRAKIFTLDGNRYEKVADVLEGSMDFDRIPCMATIDFDFVFERFR
jgi:Uma2 family endonuclease